MLARVVRRGRVISGTLGIRDTIAMVTAGAAMSLSFSVVMGSVLVVVMAVMVVISVTIPLMSVTVVLISMVMIVIVMMSMLGLATFVIVDCLSFSCSASCKHFCRTITRFPLFFYAVRVII